MDKDTHKKTPEAMPGIFETVLNELPTIAKTAKNPLRRQHMLRTMFMLAEGAETDDLKKALSNVTQRTLENDLAWFRRFGVLRSKPGKKAVGKWGHRSFEAERKAGRPSMTYYLVNPHDLITSDLIDPEERRKLIMFERRILAEPEFRFRLEREFQAIVRLVKMIPQIIEAVRPFRKIPEFKHLFKYLPRSEEVQQINYDALDAVIPGEWVDRGLVRVRMSITGEYLIPPEAAFRLRFL